MTSHYAAQHHLTCIYYNTCITSYYVILHHNMCPAPLANQPLHLQLLLSLLAVLFKTQRHAWSHMTVTWQSHDRLRTNLCPLLLQCLSLGQCLLPSLLFCLQTSFFIGSTLTLVFLQLRRKITLTVIHHHIAHGLRTHPPPHFLCLLLHLLPLQPLQLPAQHATTHQTHTHTHFPTPPPLPKPLLLATPLLFPSSLLLTTLLLQQPQVQVSGLSTPFPLCIHQYNMT